jgi:hypothetical protein
MRLTEAISLAALAAVAAGALAGCQGAAIDGATNGLDCQSAFERLKTLEGTYHVEFPGQAERFDVVWDNVSAGNAIVETLCAETPHEMVSLYYLEGEDLALTHYCGIGNRPMMRLDRVRSTKDEWIFDFDAATTGIDPRTDAHIHGATFRFRSPTEIDVEWSFWDKGAEAEKKLFQLRREPGRFTAAK